MEYTKPRNINLTGRHERNSNIIPFVHTHNPRNQNVNCIINQLNTILKEDQATRGIFENVRFISSKRQPRNLKGLLCNSKFNENHSVTKCNNPRCGTCDHLTEGTCFNFNGRSFTVNANMSCDTKNVICVITCPGCKEFYIGETGNTLRARVRVHKQHINTPEYRQIALSEHLDVCGHKQFHIFPFYKLTGGDNICRREKEKHFIRTLKPKLNNVV